MKKNAFLVVINDYQGINDLQGCINDATSVNDIPKTFVGFTNDEILVLTTKMAMH